jgi:hypothetical protein
MSKKSLKSDVKADSVERNADVDAQQNEDLLKSHELSDVEGGFCDATCVIL